MKDIIKNNIKDENYLEVLFNRISSQRNEAMNNISVLETEILKANSILQALSEENKQLKERLELQNKNS